MWIKKIKKSNEFFEIVIKSIELYNSKVESISKRVHEAICDIIRELSTMIVLERDSNFLVMHLNI